MSKRIFILVISLLTLASVSCDRHPVTVQAPSKITPTDSLPLVFPANKSDLIDKKLRFEASLKFAEHQLPFNLEEWEAYKVSLRNEIIRKASIAVDHNLPLDVRETASIPMKGYVIKTITFQTRQGVYATANLFIPDGPGPFPAVINMLGHWTKGKIDSTGPQAVGHTLAANGYVCLTIDPWGAGERSTDHGIFEYHGASLGASLMNIGEPLIGIAGIGQYEGDRSSLFTSGGRFFQDRSHRSQRRRKPDNVVLCC